MNRFPILLFILLCTVCCGRRTPVSIETKPVVFLPVLPPSELRGEALVDYMRVHYWDRFDFADTVLLGRLDTTRMLDSYATYISLYVTSSDHAAAVDSLMRRASVSRPMLDYFWMLGRRVLYDPNSPLRDDELYIPVLRAVVESPWLEEWERIASEHELRLAMQNRVGQPANDFRYTLASGKQGTLYDLKADYTLLVFSNPGCPMCRELRDELGASPRLNEMLERGELKVLAVYPDEGVDEWRSSLSEIPPAWINSYDKGCVIRSRGLYDTKAIPALYLLDSRKRVLLKDSVSVPDVEEVLDNLL